VIVRSSRRARGAAAVLAATVVAGLLVLSSALPAGHPAAQAAAESPCDIRTTERLVAVGDVHGAYDRFVAILGKAGLVDSRGRWTGGRAVLIQTGDVVDRGADSRRAVDLLRRLEKEAERAGGRVYALLGNHEVMRMFGDWRYVSAGELAAFRNGASSDLRNGVLGRALEQAATRAKTDKTPFDEDAFRERFLREVPLGFIEMRQAFDASGDYGKWLRSRPAMVKVNGVVFMHGGASDEVAALGCEGINDGVRRELAMPTPPPERMATLLSSSETGPLWYRGLAQEPEVAFLPRFEGILKALDARAIVIGHTTVLPGRITTRFGGRVIQIDTGMLDGEFYPQGVAAALEWQGNALTAIYEDRREALPALR
jgi:hypothetical protein